MSAERPRRASRIDDAGKRHHDREATASRSRRAVPPVEIEAKVEVEVEVEVENDSRFGGYYRWRWQPRCTTRHIVKTILNRPKQVPAWRAAWGERRHMLLRNIAP